MMPAVCQGPEGNGQSSKENNQCGLGRVKLVARDLPTQMVVICWKGGSGAHDGGQDGRCRLGVIPTESRCAFPCRCP